MRLPHFITADANAILDTWEQFARDVWPGGAAASPEELRDHAAEILLATARDMLTAQSPAEQQDKSHGHGRASDHSDQVNLASRQHGQGRAASGFAVAQLIAEYRALRASVVRLWRGSRPNPDAADLDDLTRFHESLDQSMAAAVGSFTDELDRNRRLFLAILGHDLRSPLAAVGLHAKLLAARQADASDAAETGAAIAGAVDSMSRLIADLLDFTAAGLGGGMPIAPAPADLAAVCRAVVDETRAARPQCRVELQAEGDAAGEWDAARLRQVVTNLVGNAVQHGGRSCRVCVRLDALSDAVRLTVHNPGPAIPPAVLATLFDPLRRAAAAAGGRRPRTGLGLYIAHQIVTAHGGTIDAASDADAGTTLTVRLPRKPPRPHRPAVA
jgi:signal transduction histidine kinase